MLSANKIKTLIYFFYISHFATFNEQIAKKSYKNENFLLFLQENLQKAGFLSKKVFGR